MIFLYRYHDCLGVRKVREYLRSSKNLICGVKYVNIVTKLESFTKNHLECVKTGRNNIKFTIGKYHINTMEIIKLFQVNIFIPVTKLTLNYLCKRKPFQIFGQVTGLFSKTNGKNWEFCVEKERERKNVND